jgi:hypothetical protein
MHSSVRRHFDAHLPSDCTQRVQQCACPCGALYIAAASPYPRGVNLCLLRGSVRDSYERGSSMGVTLLLWLSFCFLFYLSFYLLSDRDLTGLRSHPSRFSLLLISTSVKAESLRSDRSQAQALFQARKPRQVQARLRARRKGMARAPFQARKKKKSMATR